MVYVVDKVRVGCRSRIFARDAPRLGRVCSR